LSGGAGFVRPRDLGERGDVFKALLSHLADMSQGSASHRVLLVDDNDSIQEVFGELLLDQCPTIQLTSARSIQDARAILQTNVFQLVFLDDHLPDGRGHDLLDLLIAPLHTQTLVVDFTGGNLTGRESVPFLERINGRLKKIDVDAALALWLVRAGLVSNADAHQLSHQAQEKLVRMASRELADELQKMGRLICQNDPVAIARQAHCLIGFAALSQQGHLTQICETIYEAAALGQLASARQAWQFLQRLLEQTNAPSNGEG